MLRLDGALTISDYLPVLGTDTCLSIPGDVSAGASASASGLVRDESVRADSIRAECGWTGAGVGVNYSC